jgi:hypothetical protein
MKLFRRLTVRRSSADEGFAMILVIGTALVLTVVAAVAMGLAQNALRSSSGHKNFETAIATAENGVDAALAQLQQSSTWSACGCTEAPFPSTTKAEFQWASTKILSLAAAGSPLLQQDGQGQYLAIRPSDRQTVYSMSWVPSYAAWNAHKANSKSRLIKAEYILSPYAPANALLTQSDLVFSGSVLVTKSGDATGASVHTNGGVSSTNGSLEVDGDVTSSGSYGINSNANVGAGSTGNTPLQSVPLIRPEDFYTTLRSSYGGTVGSSGYTGSWYDLCDDGYVRARDTTDATPCLGTILNQSSGSPVYPYRGWNFNAAVNGNAAYWSMDEQSSPYEGIYYAYGTDVVINGKTHNGDPPWHATVLAQPKTNGNSCNKIGGTISWKLTDISNYIPGAVLIAGHDLIDTANNDAGDGLFSAEDQVYMQTSSATLTGYIIATDQCAPPSGSGLGQGPSNVQGITLDYDQTAEVPVTGIIRTTLWLESTN